MVCVTLIDPKYPRNVGAALRACAEFEAERLLWTGARVDPDGDYGQIASGSRRASKRRLPREERLWYADTVQFGRVLQARASVPNGLTPVAVEVLPGAVPLPDFQHPEDACYIFGPEDGSLPYWAKERAHHFVWIPSRRCLNLAAAVNVVLYDRVAKSEQRPRVRPAQESRSRAIRTS